MALTDEQKITLYRNLIRANHYDRMMSRRLMTGKLLGFYHPGDGGIAAGVGSCSFLRKDDFMSPHHRAHGMPHMLSKGIDLKYYLAEHTGKETGCGKGRSSWHWCFAEHGVMQAGGCIGYNFAPSVGWGWAAKRNGRDQIVMNCSGDGSYGQGRAHEALLMAMNWKLPIVFFCENNGLAIYAEASEMHPTEHISSLADGYGMPSEIVDGQDVFAVAEVALAAIDRARSGGGPTLVEAKVHRYREHDIGTPDLAGHTKRDEALIEKMKERDPMKVATAHVIEEKVSSRDEIDKIQKEAAQEIEEAERFADESPVARPSREELLAAVYA